METTLPQFETVYTLKELVAYSASSIAKRLIRSKNGADMLLLAFSEGQALKEHTVAADALVQVLEGKCQITINGNRHSLTAGQFIIMPAGAPHAVAADGKFKMLLTRIKS